MNQPMASRLLSEPPQVSTIAQLVEDATKVIAPFWPLESATAVNPLSGFEHLPFSQAVTQGSAAFGARGSLPLAAWRTLLEQGRISKRRLRDAAIESLGGVDDAFMLIGPDISRLDLLMARLLDLAVPATDTAVHLPHEADALIAKYCGAFFPKNSVMPGRRKGLYRAITALLPHDRQFLDLAGKRADEVLGAIAEDPLVTIQANLSALSYLPPALANVMKRLLARLPGWAGHIRWRCEHADAEVVEDAPAAMADLIALWTIVLRAAPDLLGMPQRFPPDPRGFAEQFGVGFDRLTPAGKRMLEEVTSLSEDVLGLIFMRAAERGFRDDLISKLEPTRANETSARAAAQLVFCIDVRSEPFRRAIEARGPYETLGYAGFFGVTMALSPADGGRRRKLLPVLLQPQFDVPEVPAAGCDHAAKKRQAYRAMLAKGWSVLNGLKEGLATSFAVAEASGAVRAWFMAERTFKPVKTKDDAHLFTPDAAGAIPLADQVRMAKGLFALTGLSAATARLVLLAGHGGCAVNNPYAAALDCGACGGHRGGSNAKALAAILNRPAVREALSSDGLKISCDTIFVAAEHDTTTDSVRIFDTQLVPPSHRAELGLLMDDLAAAGGTCRSERAARLGRSANDLELGARHWGEVRPEWGLAGNAAFIAAPRALTRALDLEGRAFLHSYDWTKDADGSALEVILTAPLIVAQWINAQYLFSTVDNDRFGAGDKVCHNVLGGIGVVRGNGGDLQVGLPRQSLFDDQGQPCHVPQRLLAILAAPMKRIEEIVDRHPQLAGLLDNGWVQLVALDPNNGPRMWRPANERLLIGDAGPPKKAGVFFEQTAA